MADRDRDKKTVNRISKRTGLGSLSSAMTNTLKGINHRGAGNAVPINKDSDGLTFFTRPRLNLSYDNAAMVRMLMPMLTDNKNTMQRYLRTTLDPVGEQRGVDTPLVDPKNPFIPLLTNNLTSMSGWPDMTADTFTSEEGIYKEAYSFIDGVSKNYSTFDITANFRNLSGDPITLLFMYWIQYATNVYEGIINPYPEMIVENEIDYQTRIYRLVLDDKRTYVNKIAACGASFPMASPLGAAFNYDMQEPFNRENDQISVPFRCMGVDYQDPVVVQEFNTTVTYFNPGMRDGQREQYYTKIQPHERPFFNYRGYPRIDIDTYELEWYVSNDVYAEINEEL